MVPTAPQIRRQYIDFFVNKYGHKEIPSASLIPENDPTVLFTTAGMHPLVPYLMGEPHPQGKRLVDAQKSLRTDDIDEVGDATHLTFFEMLGNWSLGDYFKAEAIKMSFELLTLPWENGGFGLPADRLFVSCFEGDSDAPRDIESAEIWQKIGIPKERIYFFPKKKNWWGPAGKTGPCGPDTEMFYDVLNDSDKGSHKKGGRVSQSQCNPACDCGRYVEIWNDVFMQYNKKPDGTYEPLKQKNVDTGLGFERLVTILHEKDSPFDTELFAPVMEFLKNHAVSFTSHIASCRIIADHLRAATFILGDPMGVSPSNVDQGYIVRRLIRRAIRHGKQIGISKFFTAEIAKLFIPLYENVYPELSKNKDRILDELNREEERFVKTLGRGLKELERIIGQQGGTVLSGAEAFYIFETYGFPLEMIEEELAKEGFTVNREQFQKAFDEAFKKHQEVSRAGASQKFAGGLADHTEPTKMHHTATHLVHQALRDVLGPHVFQRGSNVTGERLRFDFSHHTKMTPEQIKKVEEIVNTQIQRDMPVHFEILDFEEAKKRGAIGLFDDKYAQLGNKVKVYFMGDYSKEVCGGPHVEHTGVLKHFKILKEEACSAGIRRIKAVVEGIKDVM
ncbi:alanine--tRNA ligase [Candidatus Peregrinibacteria bacterium]|nr:alanine--tRNA ligase [Candidatus Peregrinibacteria bacterium]